MRPFPLPVPACWHQPPHWYASQARGQSPALCPVGLPGIPHPIRVFPLLRTFAISAAVPGLGTLRVANARHFLACHIFGVSPEPGKASQGPGMGLMMFLHVVWRQLVPGRMPALGLCVFSALMSGLGRCLPRAAPGQMFWQMFPEMFCLWGGERAGPDPPQV